MRSKQQLSEQEWRESLEVEMLHKRLDKLTIESKLDFKEIDSILDKLNELKDKLNKHYGINIK